MPKLTVAALRQKEDNHIISFFNQKMIAYLAFSFWCTNVRTLKDLLKQQIVGRCMENLAHFHKTTISEIKRRYGSKLDKAEVPFLNEGKIALIINKLQERRSLREKEFKVLGQDCLPGRSGSGSPGK
jgi:hypothetical protein